MQQKLYLIIASDDFIYGTNYQFCHSYIARDLGDMSQEKAIQNLKTLSGTTHFQYSGVCIYKNGQSLWEYFEIVEMNMHKLSDEEIKNYVKMENPIHAAGAYKFESMGCNLFSSVNGSSYTIRGMPLLPLLSKLREMGVINLEEFIN